MTELTRAAFRVAPLTTGVGAEILDIDLATPQPDAVIGELAAMLGRYGVIFFRDQQHLSVEDFVALGERLGSLEANDTLTHVPSFPQVGLLIKEAGHVTSIGDMWHADHTYLAEPMKYTMLRAVEVPAFGGDTLFLHTGRAFEVLPEGLKTTLRGLRALHSRTHLIKDGKYAAQFLKERPSRSSNHEASAIHPVVTRHPDSGEEVLFVNPGYVVKFDGWTAKQSRDLLAMLYEHCLQPDFQCRFRWQPGSIALWDNRQTWHYAVNDYHGHRREMQRLIIA